MRIARNFEPWGKFATGIADIFRGDESWLLALSVSMSTLSAAIETISIASILPFIAVTMDPSVIERYPRIHDLLRRVLGNLNNIEFVVCFGGFLLAIIVGGNCIGVINVLVQEKMASRTANRLCRQIFSGYLAQPYSFHLLNDSSSLLQVLLDDVRNAKNNVIVPVLLAPAKILLISGTIAVIVAQNPLIATVAGASLIGAYVTVFGLVRSRLKQLSAEYIDANTSRIRLVQEALGGIKELKVLGRTGIPIQVFSEADRIANDSDSAYRVIAQLPRFIMETIGMGGVLTYMLWLVSSSQSTSANTLPVLAMYVFAGYRILPALQGLFSSTVQIRFSLPAFYRVHADYMASRAQGRMPRQPDSASALEFRTEVRFEGASFRYDETDRDVLRKIDLVLRKGESVGIVGRTGAGKSTLADLVLGIVAPTRGKISVDGVELADETLRAAWQQNIGYVPQQVFLSNATIVANIALGLPSEKIDLDRVAHVARIAQIDEFANELPEQLLTVVGERGTKLSGGQRQRIGIARALYRKPILLVLDEATSALDNLTEDVIVSALDEISKEATLIVVSHRFRTIQKCARVIMLENGTILCDGSYDELLRSSEHFRELAGVAA